MYRCEVPFELSAYAGVGNGTDGSLFIYSGRVAGDAAHMAIAQSGFVQPCSRAAVAARGPCVQIEHRAVVLVVSGQRSEDESVEVDCEHEEVVSR